MKKSLCALVLASLFTFVAVGASFAAKAEDGGKNWADDCTVDSVNGDKITVTCEKLDMQMDTLKPKYRLKPGDEKADIEVGGTKKADEGC